jgi:hypothetical protein
MIALKAPEDQDGQLTFSGEIETNVVKEEKEGRYTLQRVKARKPRAYQAAIELLAVGKPGYEGLERIGQITGLHHLTVAAIRDDPAAQMSIDMVRDRLAKKFRAASELQVDRILEEPDIIPPAAIGITIDKLNSHAELLEGRAMSRTEHVERLDVFAGWDSILAQLPTEKELSGADVKEIGLDGGKIHLVEPPPPPAVPRLDAGAMDTESVVLPSSGEGNATESATEATESDAAAESP